MCWMYGMKNICYYTVRMTEGSHSKQCPHRVYNCLILNHDTKAMTMEMAPMTVEAITTCWDTDEEEDDEAAGVEGAAAVARAMATGSALMARAEVELTSLEHDHAGPAEGYNTSIFTIMLEMTSNLGEPKPTDGWM